MCLWTCCLLLTTMRLLMKNKLSVRDVQNITVITETPCSPPLPRTCRDDTDSITDKVVDHGTKVHTYVIRESLLEERPFEILLKWVET